VYDRYLAGQEGFEKRGGEAVGCFILAGGIAPGVLFGMG
jgi:hypothetical protein